MARRLCVALSGGGIAGAIPGDASRPDRTGLTVSIIQGYDVPHNAPIVRSLKQALDANVYRYLSTWAPTTDFVLAADGLVDVLIGLRTQGMEIQAGEVFLKEAGFAIEVFGHDSATPQTATAWVAAKPDVMSEVLESVVGILSTSSRAC